MSFLALLFLIAPAEARRHKSPIIRAINEALVQAPQDEEVCFSPEEPCDVKLVKFVASARESIDVASFDINLDQLIGQLLTASKSLKVRLVVDRRQAKGRHSAVPKLIKAGANVRYGHQRGLMHNKFILVDGKAVQTGSFNHTRHAATANNENQVYLTKPKMVERFRKRFEKLWAEGEPSG